MDANSASNRASIAFVGFGEAAGAFVKGWSGGTLPEIRAFDIKTDNADGAVRDVKNADYAAAGVLGAATVADALDGRGAVFSLVTADQAHTAARSAAAVIAPGAYFFDCNSCAPNTKLESAKAVEAAGARYVDVAVMAPVYPKMHKTPLLVSGPHADDAKAFLDSLDMNVEVASATLGVASSTKMIRSVMIKGIEALVVECVLSARKAGIDDVIIESLEKSFPGFDWEHRAAYMLERVTTHGIRRAAEMREVALTVRQLDLFGDMASATVEWQQRVGDLRIKSEGETYQERADQILAALGEK